MRAGLLKLPFFGGIRFPRFHDLEERSLLIGPLLYHILLERLDLDHCPAATAPTLGAVSVIGVIAGRQAG